MSLSPEFLRNLILRTRALMGHDGAIADDEGNFVDDRETGAPRYDTVDQSNAELSGEIEDLEPDQQAELVALMWIGRGDMEPEEWETAVAQAIERHEGSTAAYLLSQPQLAEHWDEALDRLYDGTGVVEDGEY